MRLLEQDAMRTGLVGEKDRSIILDLWAWFIVVVSVDKGVDRSQSRHDPFLDGSWK